MNVTERGQAADAIAAQIIALPGATLEEALSVTGMLAAKIIVRVTDDVRLRKQSVQAFQAAMNAQLTLETAGDHRVSQPVGRMSMEDDD